MKVKSTFASGFGPHPWQQTSWDWRAAGNFICGGAGTGLLMTTAIFVASSSKPSSWALIVLLFCGLALVGLGLLSVWLEIGRPLRALHVFLNPRTSWMSREAFVGALLFPAGLLALLGFGGWVWVTALLALLFLYCQSRMLPAARGIPAWRSGLMSPLFMLTGWCEGCGIFLLLGLFQNRVAVAVLPMFGILLVLRLLVWYRYRQTVDASLAARAGQALDRAGRHLAVVGTLVPLLLLGSSWLLGVSLQPLPIALAGTFAAWAGANAKFTLVTKASFNQGFALSRIPVRGARNSP